MGVSNQTCYHIEQNVKHFLLIILNFLKNMIFKSKVRSITNKERDSPIDYVTPHHDVMRYAMGSALICLH